MHVRVDNAHREPARGESRRKVGRHRGLAHAALAGHHAEHAGQRAGGGERVGAFGLEHRTQGGPLLRVHRAHLQLHSLDALDGGGGLAHLLLDGVLQRAALDGEQNLHLGPVSAGNRLTALIQFGMHERGLDHAELRDGAAQLGVLHTGKGRVERVLQRVIGAHGRLPPGHRPRSWPGSRPSARPGPQRARSPRPPRPRFPHPRCRRRRRYRRWPPPVPQCPR